ncbi:MAG: hypothetical protein ACI8YQ_000671 [Polaribacter sp.]|jgi:hypothetical protein
MLRIRPIEIFLIQFVCYMALWLYDDYMGSLMSIIMAGIFSAILIISLIVEWIEPSKVPRSYFYLMAASVVAPLLAMGIYVFLMGGELDWLTMSIR